MVAISSQVSRSQISAIRLLATILLIILQQKGQVTYLAFLFGLRHGRTAQHLVQTAPFSMPTIRCLSPMSSLGIMGYINKVMLIETLQGG